MLSRRNFLLGTGAGLVSAVAGSAFNTASAQGVGDRHPPGAYRPTTRIIPTPSYVHPMATGRTDEIGLAIVCAIDISGSVSSDTGEYRSQIDTLAAAIASDDFREAVMMGPKSIALCVVDYDSFSKLMVPWVDFRDNDPERFRTFAQMVRTIPRRSSGSTEQDAALENAALCFSSMPWTAKNKSVNVLTDGTGTDAPTRRWRDILAREHEATIYALTTNTGSPYLNTWCQNNLVTPPNTYTRRDGRPLSGGFVHEVATERQTQTNTLNATGFNNYSDQVLLALRRQIIMQSASLDITNPLDCARYECIRHAAYQGDNLLLPPIADL